MLIMFVLIINVHWDKIWLVNSVQLTLLKLKFVKPLSCVNREKLLDLCMSLVCRKPHSPCQLCVLKSSGSKEKACENILNWLCGQTKINRQVYEHLEAAGQAYFCNPDFVKFVSQSIDF